MMSIMPWMMMFIMSPFASGLLIYWITSNLLTVAQQKYLYSRHPGMKAMVEKEREVVARAAKEKSEPAARTGARVDPELVERARGCSRGGWISSFRPGAQVHPRPGRARSGLRGRSNVGKSSLLNAITGASRWRAPRSRRGARRS
jgi:hypothetical protein